MMNAYVQPDETTWVAVISSCSSCGDLCFVQSLVKMLHDKGLPMNCFMKTVLLNMYAKCGILKLLLDEVNRLIERMLVRTNAGVYGSLLNASWVDKGIDLGQLAVKKLFELKLENSGNYVLLSNIYASEEMWEVLKGFKGQREKWE
ncbi:hypothetical protein LguiA_007532 [Lonicera macranthoides]